MSIHAHTYMYMYMYHISFHGSPEYLFVFNVISSISQFVIKALSNGLNHTFPNLPGVNTTLDPLGSAVKPLHIIEEVNCVVKL